ncbi:hypothetical protein [Ruixingdingia sedimenti]|uniref:Uncharacterized protein n=1 Tax=Ruixingdingia sedimenti TaxID=3073604 RepID=A0ABU1F908_9RHOB|nr:hypothetical protein [Xinfangfangia sp. LG-4]MDR5653332.1 hypothetical protein [Xinfangfangia sp. LG-4]
MLFMAFAPFYFTWKNACGMDVPLACYGVYGGAAVVVLGSTFGLDLAGDRIGLARLVLAKLAIFLAALAILIAV